MFTWIDGHSMVVAALVYPVSYVLVALENGRRERRDARRAARRQAVFANRGGAR